MNNQPETLHKALKCDIRGVADEWQIDELECADELREAIETIRDDHSHEDLLHHQEWILKVGWNEKTDEVRVWAYGFNSSFTVGGSS